MYKLYDVGDRTEPSGTPSCISLGVDNSPSTETLNLRCDRKDPISLVKLFENSNFDNLHSNPEFHVVLEAFSMSGAFASDRDYLHKEIEIEKERVNECVHFPPPLPNNK
jgi:hypothetical protein